MSDRRLYFCVHFPSDERWLNKRSQLFANTAGRSSPLPSLLLCRLWRSSLSAREGAMRVVLGLRDSESPAIRFRAPRYWVPRAAGQLQSGAAAAVPPRPAGGAVQPGAARCPPRLALPRSGSDSAHRHPQWGWLVLSNCEMEGEVPACWRCYVKISVGLRDRVSLRNAVFGCY